ncbi:FMN-dependent NADH-azoreductase [Falsiruegeria mediterranea]|uniref:FMN dependent NADH:quinone oxidoreductase n=1 Tax=Falsiruegeria mediterranea M17 TaxID=1200281 RepID=A0A2R8CCC2_9RHOB|nr:NAD(P)H-dependent oxidoreductase [Falsiruegeria mediterranea]SPJ30041.1 FMN-dependent NADH-azoreductase [Falsiruegeria mediterranea M17]
MTSTVLHIDTSARRQGSATRELTGQIVKQISPARIIRRDLATPLPLINEDWVNANFTPADARTDEQQDLLSLSDQLVAEIKDSDTVVIGLPMYNFGAPASFKVWVDLIARAGLTFQYTAEGPKGLLSGKRVIVAVATGGVPLGSPVDHLSGYIRQIMGFIGLTDVEFVAAEGMSTAPETALQAARDAVAKLAA